MSRNSNFDKAYKTNVGTKLCVLPWIHLATHPIGVATPCCVADMKNGASFSQSPEGRNYKLSQDKLTDIANSPRFNKIRRQMVNGEEPAVCSNCFFYEKNKIGSKRYDANNQYADIIDECFKNTNEDGSLKELNYRYIELRLGNVCNLKCVTCNAFSSSKWNEDTVIFSDTQFEKIYPKVEKTVEWYRDTKFYDELFTHCKDLREIWINGGEPTLIKEHGYFLEKFINDGTCKDIELHYSLNCTAFPDKFIEQWKQFKKVKIHLSIDDLGDRIHYVRFPSRWDVTYRNLQKILQYKHIFNIQILQTVSLLNIHNMVNFKQFTLNHDIEWVMNFVKYPDHLSVRHLPEELKELISNNLNGLTDEEKNKVRVEVQQQGDNNGFSKFLEFIHRLDTKRNLNIGEYLPEWAEYFDNYKTNNTIAII